MNELTQKRVQNCIITRNKFKRGTWGYKFWNNTMKNLVRMSRYEETEVLIMRLVLRERLENKDGDVQSL